MADLKKLTAKQKAFCEEYVKNGYNATRAYQTAYEVSYESAKVAACGVFKKPHVKEYIAELQQEAFQAAAISAERVALKLAEIAFAEKDDENYAASAQLKALDLLQKQLGLQTQKVDAKIDEEITITVGYKNKEAEVNED